MNIQLALDRLTVEEAINIAKQVEETVEWIEVGTSLIKEFGVQCVKQIKENFPDKIIVADTKTFDNAVYECQIAFEAGADVITVMGAAPIVTIDLCRNTAKKYNKQVMVDLLNVSTAQLSILEQYEDVILCKHISKDEQETGNQKKWEQTSSKKQPLAVAGGITIDAIPALKQMDADVLIVGSSITKAPQPKFAAQEIKKKWEEI